MASSFLSPQSTIDYSRPGDVHHVNWRKIRHDKVVARKLKTFYINYADTVIRIPSKDLSYRFSGSCQACLCRVFVECVGGCAKDDGSFLYQARPLLSIFPCNVGSCERDDWKMYAGPLVPHSIIVLNTYLSFVWLRGPRPNTSHPPKHYSKSCSKAQIPEHIQT